MLQAEKTLYWFTPFFTRTDLPHFINQCSAENCKAFFCLDSRWNHVSMDDLQLLKNKLQKLGVRLMMIEGRIEKSVPSVARVLKAGRVVYAKPEYHIEFETAIKKICRELELHSIAFCDHSSTRLPPYNGGGHPSFRHAV